MKVTELHERLVKVSEKGLKFQESVDSSLRDIRTNLKTLNDHNILHSTKTDEQHKTMGDNMKLLVDKYFYLLALAIIALAALVGVKLVT